MTLLLSITSPAFSVMVSDRLLSGDHTDPDANKVGVLECDDARFVVGFTGLATFIEPTTGRHTFQTHQWIAEEVAACAEPDYTGIGVIDRFNDRLKHKWAAAPFSRWPIAVLFGGYVYPKGQMGTWRIANYDRPTIDLRNSSGAVTAAGYLRAVPMARLRKLLAMARDSAPLGPMLSEAVATVREASEVRDDRGQQVIGRNCSSLCVPAQRDLAPIFGYHAEAPVGTRRYGNVIDCRRGVRGRVLTDISYTTQGSPDDPWSHLQVPKVGRNDPCPCGSGKKWKRCHGLQPRPTPASQELLFRFKYEEGMNLTVELPTPQQPGERTEGS